MSQLVPQDGPPDPKVILGVGMNIYILSNEVNWGVHATDWSHKLVKGTIILYCLVQSMTRFSARK